MDLSVIVPVYNEEDNLRALYKELKSVIDFLNKEYEIIFIDDGSSDNSFLILKEFSENDSRIRIIRFKKNYGLISAFDAGFHQAQGDFILAIDADLQVKADDLIKIYEELKSYDAVVGWRRNRIKADGFIKWFSSIIANSIRRIVLREEFHDAGCPLKGFRKSTVKELLFYNSFEYFLFSMLKMKRFRIKEIYIEVMPRIHGKSKFNIKNRIWKSLVTLLVVKWMQGNKMNYQIKEMISKKPPEV